MPGRCRCTNHPYPAAGWPDDRPCAARPRASRTPTAKLAAHVTALAGGLLQRPSRPPGAHPARNVERHPAFHRRHRVRGRRARLPAAGPRTCAVSVVVGFVLGIADARDPCAVGRDRDALRATRLPVSLIIVTAIDLVIDGLVLGIAFSASDESGIILTVALTLEVLFLALSVSARRSRPPASAACCRSSSRSNRGAAEHRGRGR